MLPTSQGAWARSARRACEPCACAPWEFAPTRWATPPYRGHKAKFAACETPPGRGWFGAEVGFSIYIHRRGFTSTTTNSHQPSLLPPKACGREGGRAGAGAPYAHTPRAHTPRAQSARAPETPAYAGGRPKRAYASALRALNARPLRANPTRESTRRALQASTLREHPARAPYPRTTCARTLRARPTRALSLSLPARSASSHQHAGQAHHAGVLHPPVAGFISTPAGLLRRARAEAVSCSASCRVKAYANDTARQPTPTRKPRPRGGPSTTPNTATDTGPSAWRERRHQRRHCGVTPGAKGTTGRLFGPLTTCELVRAMPTLVPCCRRTV